MARLKDILQQQRKKNFVGRQQELDLFRSLLQQKAPVSHLLYIQGPGGQGKTTLLKQFADCCKEAGITAVFLDGRNIEPHPASFREALEKNNPFGHSKTVWSGMEASKNKVLLFIDSYEKLKPLDDWFRLEFLPELPDQVITVMAGRSPLSTPWRTDPGWYPISKIISLKELSAEESAQFLTHRQIPKDQVKRIVSYTHGNALALSIVADMFDQRKDSRFDPLDSPDVMKALMDQFIQEVPSPAHKAALELCSLVHVTTETLIEEVLGAQMAHELFNWLSSLTVTEKSPAGIYLHDIVRDTIASEMQWRNPEWHRHLHRKVQHYFSSRVMKYSGQRQRDLLFNLIFLHRMNPAVKPFFEFQEAGSSWQDTVKPEDIPALAAIIKKYEGAAAANHFITWSKHPAATIWVFRDADKLPAGFVLSVSLEKINSPTHDKAINALLPVKQKWKTSAGELITVFRHWMSRDHYQNVGGVQSAIFLGMVQAYFTPRLAISLLHCANPGFWNEILSYADLHYLPELAYETNGQSFGWYMHDWRLRNPQTWLDLMAKREVHESDTDEETGSVSTQPSLTEKDFVAAVHAALKQIRNPKKIIGNPLLDKNGIKTEGSEPADIDRALALAERIQQAISSLEHSPKDESLHRVLYRTFVNPVGGQEQTADFLYMSFSTYRRQVRKAVERVADILWLEQKQAL